MHLGSTSNHCCMGEFDGIPNSEPVVLSSENQHGEKPSISLVAKNALRKVLAFIFPPLGIEGILLRSSKPQVVPTIVPRVVIFVVHNKTIRNRNPHHGVSQSVDGECLQGPTLKEWYLNSLVRLNAMLVGITPRWGSRESGVPNIGKKRILVLEMIVRTNLPKSPLLGVGSILKKLIQPFFWRRLLYIVSVSCSSILRLGTHSQLMGSGFRGPIPAATGLGFAM